MSHFQNIIRSSSWLFLVVSLVFAQADPTDNETKDRCVLIYGQHCDTSGICQQCAMCTQSSCILASKAKPWTGSSRGTDHCEAMFGALAYDWYGYCLVRGNTSSGAYCATSTACKQFHQGFREPTFEYSRIYDAVHCLLKDENPSASDVGTEDLPETLTGTMPMLETAHRANGTTRSGGNTPHHYLGVARRSPFAFALTATCLFLFIIGMIWIARLWMHSRPKTARSPTIRQRYLQVDPTLPTMEADSEARPFRFFFLARPTMAHSAHIRTAEHLPTYADALEPPLPKYEHTPLETNDRPSIMEVSYWPSVNARTIAAPMIQTPAEYPSSPLPLQPRLPPLYHDALDPVRRSWFRGHRVPDSHTAGTSGGQR